MAHSNGHPRDDNSIRTLSPVLSWNQPASQSADQVDSKDSYTSQELLPETEGGVVAAEWIRVSRLAMKHLNRCVALEPKVLHGDDPDAIHDLRVATRRLQQVLDLLYPSPHSGEFRRLYRGLKRCRRSLSEIRNYDVLLARVDGALARKRTARREAWEAIRNYLKERRSARLEKGLRKLAKTNLSAIYVHLKDYLPGEKNAGPAAEHSDLNAAENLTVEEFYARISGSLKKVWASLEEEIAQSRQEPGPTVLHRTRIAAKRVRYLAEVIHAFDVPGSKDVLIWLRNLQTQLGDWHDLVVFEEAVIEMLADTNFLREHLEMAVQIERLVMRNRTQKAKLETKYYEMTRLRTGFLKTRDWVRRVVDSPATVFAGSG